LKISSPDEMRFNSIAA